VRISLRGVDALGEIERIAAAEPFVTPAQVHGTRIVAAAETLRWPQREPADGIFVRPGDPVAGLRFGDCAPVVVLSISDGPWLLALHSGFKGTLHDIVAAGMEFVRARGVVFDPRHLFAWVGPCIAGSCYTRRMDDPSTVEALRIFAADAITPGEKFARIDLKRQIAFQLANAGVPVGHICLETQCTCCQTGLFYSHRKSTPENDPRMLLTIREKIH